MSKHPIQPLEKDAHGVVRFKANAIVRHLVDNGSIGLNDIASMDFSQEDREQLAQLIGYSHSGAGDLHYFSDEVLEVAMEMYENGLTIDQARNEVLAAKLDSVRASIKDAAVELFKIHPDDLESQ